ncbi:transposase [Paraburkholderia sejongensis]|uniref:transposase n=1 Tax=Paraburkholderia sejongensis TaxID=2886946 RepID=UPI003CE5ACC2
MEEFTPFREITDEQWARVSPLFLQERPESSDRRGRPLVDARSVLNGVLWVMYSGACWAAMPSRYPPHTTCHRRFKAWSDSGLFDRVTDALAGCRVIRKHPLSPRPANTR